MEWRCLRPERSGVFMRQDVPEEWRKFYIEELHYFHSSNILRVIKLGRSETGEEWKR